jgi:hypothetical protein
MGELNVVNFFDEVRTVERFVARGFIPAPQGVSLLAMREGANRCT